MSKANPEGWVRRPLKELADIVSGGTPPRARAEFWQGGTIPWATPTDITGTSGRTLTTTAEFITESALRASSAKLLPVGTVLMTSRATLGAMKIAGVPACTNQGFKSLVPNLGVNSWFLYYQIDLHKEEYARYGIGTTFLEVNKKDTERFEIPLPTDEGEQREIARILSTVDALIEKSEAVVSKRVCKRVGLLDRLMGAASLASDSELTDEVGTVPVGWTVKPLGAAIETVIDYRGRTPKKMGMDWGGGNIPALSANNVQMGGIDFDAECHLGSDALYVKWMGERPTAEGDVLFTMEAPLGNVARIPDDRKYIISQRVILLRGRADALDNGFLYYHLIWERFQRVLETHSTGTTATGIQRAKLERLLLRLPPLPEQRRISSVMQAMDRSLQSEKRLLQKLRSLKTALMQDLLSGKVRVQQDAVSA